MGLQSHSVSRCEMKRFFSTAMFSPAFRQQRPSQCGSPTSNSELSQSLFLGSLPQVFCDSVAPRTTASFPVHLPLLPNLRVAAKLSPPRSPHMPTGSLHLDVSLEPQISWVFTSSLPLFLTTPAFFCSVYLHLAEY